MDVILQGLAGLLLAATEVPEVTRADICPLEISDEDPLEVRPVTDAIMWEEFKLCLNVFPHTDGQILNDEKVIIHLSGSVGEPKIFKLNTEVCLPSVLGNVGGWSEALWEWRSPDTPAKGPWSQAIRTGTPIVWSMTMPGRVSRSPRWSSQGLCRLPSSPPEGCHHHIGPDAGC